MSNIDKIPETPELIPSSEEDIIINLQETPQGDANISLDEDKIPEGPSKIEKTLAKTGGLQSDFSLFLLLFTGFVSVLVGISIRKR